MSQALSKCFQLYALFGYFKFFNQSILIRFLNILNNLWYRIFIECHDGHSVYNAMVKHYNISKIFVRGPGLIYAKLFEGIRDIVPLLAYNEFTFSANIVRIAVISEFH